jgi:preprotein translocase subunit SecA
VSTEGDTAVKAQSKPARNASHMGQSAKSNQSGQIAVHTAVTAGGGVSTTQVGKVADKTKLGRNDPCWCGSGKKYKKCHYPN